jgi:murein DD-endopeptidase MepM/ murein hydrolase activator NlpD
MSGRFLKLEAWSFSEARMLVLGIFLLGSSTFAEQFQLPTANHFLFEPGGGEKFFVGTVGKSWESGCFGCVRSDGWQMHEGLDIRCLQRDKRGEPTDPVMATADGIVAYINTKPSLSNYGNYIVLKHSVEGLEIYSLYAHLSAVAPGLKTGQTVKAGETIATMGHTSNTHEGISKDRAHVHFELNLLVNERFPEWFKKTSPGERNDHGQFNGQNILGLDSRLILLGQREQGAKFSLVKFIQDQPALCRVLVRKTNFPWLHRYAPLIKPNPTAQKDGVAGYEIALNFNGIAFELIPRAESEIKSKAKYQLVSVNETEYQKNHCRRLVIEKGGKWRLAPHGEAALDLLTY